MAWRFAAYPVVVLAGSIAGAEAWAGAWTLPRGEGQAIVTGTFTKATRAFDDDGRLIPVADYEKFELTTLVEYGIENWLTALFQPSLQHVEIDGPFGGDRFGLGYTDLGARARLWSDDRSVVSGQVVARLPGTGQEGNPAAIGKTDPELDLRLLFGRGFTYRGWSSFVDAQIAYRPRFDDPPDEFRFDLTFGVRPHPKFLVLAQSFNVFADGSAKGVFENGREHKLQLSGVWDFSDAWSVQLGGVATVAGEEALNEVGVLAGLWRRF